jgi:hypothetical protein
MTGKRGSPIERFERHYIPEPNSGCWLWIGYIHLGYGYMNMPGNRPIRAHVFAYEHFKGPVQKGLDVCHLCHVRCCVNPEHLMLGTRIENVNQTVTAGRQAKGFRLPHTKLTLEQVAAIRIDPRKHKIIAQEYGIGAPYVSMLQNGFRRCE